MVNAEVLMERVVIEEAHIHIVLIETDARPHPLKGGLRGILLSLGGIVLSEEIRDGADVAEVVRMLLGCV